MDTVCNLVIPIVDVPIVGMTTYSEYTYNRYTLYGYTHYRCPYNGCILYRRTHSGYTYKGIAHGGDTQFRYGNNYSELWADSRQRIEYS